MSSEEMNLSVNGHSRVPPGFRFHPTEEELLHYYLRKKVGYQKIDLDVIPDVDLNKLEPWDIQEKCRIGSTPQNDWYFFSHKDKKYPTGTRTNRATAAGFWKATGRDKVIFSSMRRIGMRKTLVFYKGRAPHGQKSDWIMHEYRLDEHDTTSAITLHSASDSAGGEDGWVVCRLFKKKNYHRALGSPQGSSSTISLDSRRLMRSSTDHDQGDVMDQILLYMGKSCKKEDLHHPCSNTAMVSNNSNPTSHMQFITNPAMISTSSPEDDIDDNQLAHARFLHLPRLENTSPSLLPLNHTNHHDDKDCSFKSIEQSIEEELMFTTHQTSGPTIGDHHHDDSKNGQYHDWAALDRLVASQLNGQAADTSSKQLSSCCYSQDQPLEEDDEDFFSFSFDHHDSGPLSNPPRVNKINQGPQVNNNELWNFLRTSSSASSTDPLWNLSV